MASIYLFRSTVQIKPWNFVERNGSSLMLKVIPTAVALKDGMEIGCWCAITTLLR